METWIKSSQNVIVFLLQCPSSTSPFTEVIPSGWTQNRVLESEWLYANGTRIFYLCKSIWPFVSYLFRSWKLHDQLVNSKNTLLDYADIHASSPAISSNHPYISSIVNPTTWLVCWDPTVTTKRQRDYFNYYVSLLYLQSSENIHYALFKDVGVFKTNIFLKLWWRGCLLE